jgi:hypothetical protein
LFAAVLGLVCGDEAKNMSNESTRANLMIVREHLDAALRAHAKGDNSEVLRQIVAAIKEIER